eukprot:4754182-Amphidinium_carterae.3
MPAVRSLTTGVVCKNCQSSVAGKKWAQGWFTCRGCGMRLPNEAGGSTTGTTGTMKHCQNCGIKKQWGTQTCKKCGAKFEGTRGEVSRKCSLCTA